MDYQFSLKYIGDSNVCSKYSVFAKNKARQFAIEKKDNFVKTLKLTDFIKDKQCTVTISITGTLPFLNIVIKTDLIADSKPVNSNSGLTINELDYNNNFSKFYPKGGSDFIDYNGLYKSSQITNYINYYKTYQGKNINQNHYIYGRQFTGQMAIEVQKIISTNNVDCNYLSFWDFTNGIYIDSQSNPWLITVSIAGLYCRKLVYNNVVDSTVTNSNGIIQKPITNKILDGKASDVTDTLLLNTGFFYTNSFPIAENQGWAFNKKGNLIQNINFTNDTNKVYSNRYQIEINETVGDLNVITLNANFTLIESGSFIPNSLDNFLIPNYLNDNPYIPESISNLNYTQSKNGSLTCPYFNIALKNPEEISISNNKAPISIFFDSNDNPKVLYYVFNKTLNTKTTIGTFDNLDSFFYNNIVSNLLINTGYLTIKNDDNSYNLGTFNCSIKHGFMFNSDESTLSNDNIGEYTNNYSYDIPSGSDYNDEFYYNYENGLLSVDLTPYETFNVNSLFTGINDKISLYQSYVNNFNTFYKTTQKTISSNNYTFYNLHQQVLNINYFLNSFDTNNIIYRLDSIIDILNFTKLNKLILRDINNPLFLYNYDNTVLNVFENLNSTSITNFSNDIDDLNNYIGNLNLSSNYTIYIELQQFMINFYNYLKANKDTNLLNITILNNTINNINQYIIIVNEVVNNINTIITNTNDIISGTDFINILNLLNSYNNIIDSYEFNTDGNDNVGLTFEQVSFSNIYPTTTTKDTYFVANKLSKITYKKVTTIENRKLTNNTLIFNHSDRNTYNIYSQQNTYNSLNYYNNLLETNIIHGIVKTNLYNFYKRTDIVQDVITGTIPGQVVSYGDYTLVDSNFYNYKSKTVYDYLGSAFTFNGGDGGTVDYTNELIYSLNSITTPYIDVYLNDFSTINYTSNKFHLSNRNYNFNEKTLNYNKTILTNLKIYDDSHVITNSTTISDDFRLIPLNISDNNFDYKFKFNNYNLYQNDDGTIYFNYMRDVYSWNYIVSKDFYKYSDNKQFLTNITNYNIIKSSSALPCNFIGTPF